MSNKEPRGWSTYAREWFSLAPARRGPNPPRQTKHATQLVRPWVTDEFPGLTRN